MKASPFKGKDNKAEEKAEARQLRAGKVSPAQYVKKEKAEGDMKSTKSLLATGKKLASGKMSPASYAKSAKK